MDNQIGVVSVPRWQVKDIDLSATVTMEAYLKDGWEPLGIRGNKIYLKGLVYPNYEKPEDRSSL